MIKKGDKLLRLEKILQRFGDSPAEAAVALDVFRATLAAEGLKAVDLRLDIDGEHRSSADALLRAFEKINTPSKRQVQELETKIEQLERENVKLRSEIKIRIEEARELKTVKRNYVRSKSRKKSKANKLTKPTKPRTDLREPPLPLAG
jgi:hypothetical protein